MSALQGEMSTPAITPSEGKQKSLSPSKQYRCRNVCLYDNNEINNSASKILDDSYKGLSLIPNWDSRFANRLQQLKQKKNSGAVDNNRDFLRTTTNNYTEIIMTRTRVDSNISKISKQELYKAQIDGQLQSDYRNNFKENQYANQQETSPLGRGGIESSDSLSRTAHMTPSDQYQLPKRMQHLTSTTPKKNNMPHQQDDDKIKNENNSLLQNSKTSLETMVVKSTRMVKTSQRLMPILPGSVIIESIGSYVNDRRVWNSLASLNRETFAISRNFKHLCRPWPSIRWRVTTKINRSYSNNSLLQGQHRRRRIARGAVQTSARPRCVAFGKDYLCCGTDRGDVLVRHVYGNGATKILRGHEGCINSVKCCGNWLVSAGDDLETRMWNMVTMSCEVILRGHNGSITSTAILPFEQNNITDRHGIQEVRKTLNCSTSPFLFVATAGLDGDVHLYAIHFQGNKIESARHCSTFALESQPNPVHSIVLYEKDGHRSLISGGVDGQLRLWDVDAASIGCIENIDHDFNAETDSNVSATHIHDTICIDRYDGEIKSIALSRDKERIAVAFGRTICHSNLSVKTPGRNNFLQHHDHNHRRRRRLEDQRRLRNLSNNEPEERSGNGTEGDIWKVLRGHSGDIRCIDFSPDGKTIASACSDGFIRLWEVGEGTWKRKWKGHNGFMVSSLVVSPDGQSLLSAGSDGTMKIESLFP